MNRSLRWSIACGLVSLLACVKVPMTGRRSLILVPDQQVSALAVDSYRELIKKSRLSEDREAVEMIRRVGRRIAAVSNHPGYEWEFNLIEEPKTVNAFCMPGGKVAFFTGILPITQNETGVAIVMGHEVAHAIAKHGAERLSQQLLVTMGGISLDLALRNRPEQTRALAGAAFGLGSELGYILPFGRMQESEADHIGLLFAARAGYDPREAVDFWKRMEAASKGAPPEFLSTHPGYETRVKNIQEWMPEALEDYRSAQAKKN